MRGNRGGWGVSTGQTLPPGGPWRRAILALVSADPPPPESSGTESPDAGAPDAGSQDTAALEPERPTMETTVFHVPRPRFAANVDPMWQIRVEVVGGAMDGLRSRVDGDRLDIGRRIDNDLCLTMDPGVSARHACIVRRGRSFWLEDLGSRNGTFLGEERLQGRVPIGPGVTFAVNRTQVQFMPR